MEKFGVDIGCILCVEEPLLAPPCSSLCRRALGTGLWALPTHILPHPPAPGLPHPLTASWTCLPMASHHLIPPVQLLALLLDGVKPQAQGCRPCRRACMGLDIWASSMHGNPAVQGKGSLLGALLQVAGPNVQHRAEISWGMARRTLRPP